MVARYYSSSLGSFMAVDPGEDTTLADPQSWNKYGYASNNPLSRIDPDGRTDIYIGGAADHRKNFHVQRYAAEQAKAGGRTVKYFAHNQIKEATKFANDSIGNGEPMNIIGHSWGADSAIKVAAGVQGTVDNLVGVDAVGRMFRPGGDSRPENVDNVVSVVSKPADRDSSDCVEIMGVMVGGRPDAFEHNSDTVINATKNHSKFKEQYETKGKDGKSAKDIVDESYSRDRGGN